MWALKEHVNSECMNKKVMSHVLQNKELQGIWSHQKITRAFSKLLWENRKHTTFTTVYIHHSKASEYIIKYFLCVNPCYNMIVSPYLRLLICQQFNKLSLEDLNWVLTL